MTRKFLALAAMCATCLSVGAADAVSFSYDEDFSLSDERGLSPAIAIERRSGLSHLHGEVNENGYTLLVPGNRHYLAMPPVGDFSLEADCVLGLHDLEFGLGYYVFFGGGHTLRVYFDKDGKFGLYLDDRKFADGAAVVGDDKSEYADNLKVALKGGHLSVSAFGTSAEVAVPDAARGKVGFDLCYSGGNQLTLRHVVLKSEDAPAKSVLSRTRYALSRCQGFSENLVYDIAVSRYATGDVELDVELSGLLGSASGRIETGCKEWASMADRLDTPYVRVESKAGDEIAVLPLWNGMRTYSDPEVKRRAMKRSRYSGEAKMAIPKWPVRKRFMLPCLPDDWTIAAGYVAAMENPNRLAGNGPYEQIRDKSGALLYEGGSIRRGHVAVKVVPTPDPRFVARIPKDLPRYDEAVAHASTQGYFLESTVPSFSVCMSTHPGEFAPSELSYRTSVTTVYGEPVGEGVRLPVGVYHYVVDWKAGAKTGRETFVFEVLSDDPEGPCPALASKLPTLYAMPNEVKFLEETVFDPWAQFGGIQHYYAMSTHYPAVGMKYRVWDALRPYRRKWFAQNTTRNSGDARAFSPWNVEVNKVADYTYSLDDAGIYGDRYDFSIPNAYREKQLRLLKDYYALKRPPTKLLTPERFAEIEKNGGGLSKEEFQEMFHSCWEGFCDWARPLANAEDAAFERRLLAVNPRLARAGYGPMSLYNSTYKSPYWLRAASKGTSTIPEFRANGSFWVFEEYHHSCDYPICRASFFVAAYDYHYPNSRRIFPEIYYSAWGRCNDGAVFQAHPGKHRFVAPGHQRRLVFDYVYGTAHFKGGEFGYWKDYGFHARNPETETMAEFVKAWGITLKNPPKAPPRTAFAFVDFGAFRRHGDYLETECNWKIDVSESHPGGYGDVCNTAEESIAYLYEQVALGGSVAPVVTDFRELDAVTPDKCSIAILPPIVAGTPPETLAAIRRLHARGVALLASEEVVGLEDIFGVKPCAPRKICGIGEERFSHKLALAKYESAGAKTLLCSSDGAGLVFAHEAGGGRAAFIAAPPTVLNRASMRGRYGYGQPNVSAELAKGVRDALAFLDPKPSVEAGRGEVCAAYTDGGAFVVTIGDTSPIYRDGGTYPVQFRVAVRVPGVGSAKVETDAKCEVVSRSDDELVFWTETEKDSALFFRFVNK